MWGLSQLSPYDRAALSASFYYHWDERLNCRMSSQALLKRTKDPVQTALLVKAKFGCDTVADSPRLTIDGFDFHTCLCNFSHPLFFSYLELGDKLDRGILPDRGAYLDQPAQMLEALQLLGRLKSEAQQAEQINQEKKAKQHGRK